MECVRAEYNAKVNQQFAARGMRSVMLFGRWKLTSKSMAANAGSDQTPTLQDFAYVLAVARKRLKEYPTADNEAAYNVALLAFSERAKQEAEGSDSAPA